MQQANTGLSLELQSLLQQHWPRVPGTLPDCTFALQRCLAYMIKPLVVLLLLLLLLQVKDRAASGCVLQPGH
jgi:hypothetical protein